MKINYFLNRIIVIIEIEELYMIIDILFYKNQSFADFEI